MKIKSFKERRDETLWWMSGLITLFLIVGGLLVSDLSFEAKYDSVKAYNLFKDAFSFGATILTPIVAVFFFSDWREQHIAKQLETKSWGLYEHVQKLYWELLEYKLEIQDDENSKSDKQVEMHARHAYLMDENHNLKKLIEAFDQDNDTTKEIVDLTTSIYEGFLNELFYLEKAYYAIFAMSNPEEYLGVYVDDTVEQVVAHYDTEYKMADQEWTNSYVITKDLVSRLKPLADAFKIQV